MTPGPQDKASALRAHATGLHTDEAAVDLLINHASWLRRDDFLDRHVHLLAAPSEDMPMATIDWPETITALDRGELPCSDSEAGILRVAASLAEGIPIALRDALTGLDLRNTNLLCHAIRHATGHPAS